MKIIKYLLFAALPGTLLPACFIVKDKKTQKKPIQTVVTAMSGLTRPLDSVKKNTPKRFSEVITSGFKTDSGFLSIHHQEDKYFLEVPDDMLGRDILLLSRMAKAAADNRINRGEDGFAGSKIGEKVIRFNKGPRQKLFIQTVSYKERSADSSANGMYKNLERSTLLPIAAVFDIKAKGRQQQSSLIDISDFIAGDQPLLGFDAGSKRSYGLGPMQKDKSYVSGMQAFDTNLELQTMNTYTKGENIVSYELNNSFVLLPQSPMRPRYADTRIGYFTEGYTDFDMPQGVKPRSLITRFRLEPRPEDVSRYLAGELVEPQKPIVYYIDPATPKKWVKYLIQGVNDWQKAFEKAGFKNAIYALEAPENQKNWSLYDAKHNAIVYLPSSLGNAMGPHVHDPRSGEIIETHISWYHNVMSLVHDWYMVQASPNDPAARKMVFDDELMGQLIRFVSSHEVGHTLGLHHNFAASSAIPVDSLRSKTYLEKNGFCPSIMDYARFNYVAQPEDKIPPHLLMPRIGVYDEWVIEWGYRWFPPTESAEQEILRMSNWITERLKKDKRLLYKNIMFGPDDPRAQTEDLGDDAVKAGNYGIKNLKVVASNLLQWTHTPGGQYENFDRMHKAVVSQYQRYLGHVLYNITLSINNPKTEEESASRFGYLAKSKRKAAVSFLQKQLFDTPDWLFNSKEAMSLGVTGPAELARIQEGILGKLLSSNGYQSLLMANSFAPAKEKYTFNELLDDLSSGIWNELKTGKIISPERRMLQRLYIEKLIAIQYIGVNDQFNRQDAVAIIKSHLRGLISSIENGLRVVKNKDSRIHMEELVVRLKWVLKPESYIPEPGAKSPISMPTALVENNGVEQ